MDHALLFVGAVCGLLSIVPLSIWAATGRFKDAVQALKEYLLCLGILAALAIVMSAASLIGMISS